MREWRIKRCWIWAFSPDWFWILQNLFSKFLKPTQPFSKSVKYLFTNRKHEFLKYRKCSPQNPPENHRFSKNSYDFHELRIFHHFQHFNSLDRPELLLLYNSKLICLEQVPLRNWNKNSIPSFVQRKMRNLSKLLWCKTDRILCCNQLNFLYFFIHVWLFVLCMYVYVSVCCVYVVCMLYVVPWRYKEVEWNTEKTTTTCKRNSCWTKSTGSTEWRIHLMHSGRYAAWNTYFIWKEKAIWWTGEM